MLLLCTFVLFVAFSYSSVRTCTHVLLCYVTTRVRYRRDVTYAFGTRLRTYVRTMVRTRSYVQYPGIMFLAQTSGTSSRTTGTYGGTYWYRTGKQWKTEGRRTGGGGWGSETDRHAHHGELPFHSQGSLNRQVQRGDLRPYPREHRGLHAHKRLHVRTYGVRTRVPGTSYVRTSEARSTLSFFRVVKSNNNLTGHAAGQIFSRSSQGSTLHTTATARGLLQWVQP